MIVYDVEGNALSTAYDIRGNALSAAYDREGTLLDEVDFADETIITDIFTSSITQQPQGGCIDDDGNVYVCFFSNAGKLLKHNINTGVELQVSFTGGTYGHANGMTYNPNTGYLYLASMNNTGEVYVFDTSLNLVNTLYARDSRGAVFNCWNIAYDRIGNRFVTMSNGTIYFFDDSFKLISTGAYTTNDWPNTRQDIETDGAYIYALSAYPHKICVFNMKGQLIKQIVNTAFIGEPESMCYDWINGIYYIEGKASSYVIRKAEFIN